MEPIIVSVTGGDEFPISVDVTNTPGSIVDVSVTEPAATPIDVTVSQPSVNVVDVSVTETPVGPIDVVVNEGTPSEVAVTVTEIVPAPIEVDVVVHPGGPQGPPGPLPPTYAADQLAQDNEILDNAGLISANSGLISALQAAELNAVLLNGSRTMTGDLVIDTVDASAIRIGSWLGGPEWAAIESENGYVLLGRGDANGAYFRTKSAADFIHIGVNDTNDLSLYDTYIQANTELRSNSVPIRRYDGAAYMGFGFVDASYGRFETTATNFYFPKTIQPVQILAYNDGTDAAPAYSFRTNSNSGMYEYADAGIQFSANGVRSGIVTSANVYWRANWYTPSTAGFYMRTIDSNGRQAYFSSSKKVKKDIEPIDRQRAKDLVKGLKPVWFRSKNEVDREDHSYYGFLAEDVLELDPRFVQMRQADDCTCDVDPDEVGPKWLDHHTCEIQAGGIDYPALVAPLVEVVHEMEEIIESQQATIADLVARVEALESIKK
jgi:hypothetical protein